MSLERIIPLLHTYAPIEIFKKVIAYNAECQSIQEGVQVRIGFSTGFILEGKPLKIDKDGNVILASLNDTISYVNVHALSGIEIMNPSIILDVLTNGRYFEAPKNEIPTSLQLKRNFKSRSEEIEEKYGFKLESKLVERELKTEVEKYQFEKFITILEIVVHDIWQSQLGVESLNELEKICINLGSESLIVEKNNKQIEVNINFKNKFSNNFKEQFKIALESKL